MKRNDYSRRAEWYQTEFASEDDFGMLQGLLTSHRGRTLDIPCGVGRLVPLLVASGCPCDCVDSEVLMVAKCVERIRRSDAAQLLSTHVGDMLTWHGRDKYKLIVIARGGAQLVSSPRDLLRLLVTVRQNLERDGVALIDIHCPWSASTEEVSSLPEFMRFAGSDILRGSHVFHDGGHTLKRCHEAVLLRDELVVRFDYEIDDEASHSLDSWSGSYRWQRIDKDLLLYSAEAAGLLVSDLWGGYRQQPYRCDSARLIAVIKVRSLDSPQ